MDALCAEHQNSGVPRHTPIPALGLLVLHRHLPVLDMLRELLHVRRFWASDGRRCATVMPGHSTIAGRKRAVTRRPRGVSGMGALLWDQESQRRGVCGAAWPLIEALALV